MPEEYRFSTVNDNENADWLKQTRKTHKRKKSDQNG